MRSKNKYWNKKGASPLIATVILIGLAIALSISIFTFTSSNLSDIQKITEKQIISSELIDFEIKRTITTSNNIKLLIANNGPKTISNFDVSIITNKNILVVRSPGIEPFSTKWIESNISIKENVSSVKVTPLTTQNEIKYVHELSKETSFNIENNIISIDQDSDGCLDNLDFNRTDYCPVSTCSLDLRNGCSNRCQHINCNVNEQCDSGVCKPTTLEEQNFTLTNETEQDTQLEAEINKPVKWIKKIRLKEPGIAKIELRKEATNIIVKEERDTILDISDRINKTKSENGTEILVNYIVQNLTIEYETPAPLLYETNLSSYSKLITVSSDVHYTNVISYIDLPKEASENGVRLYWINNGAKQLVKDLTYIDLNNNSLVDRIKWIVPRLSNQTYELSISILNPVEYLRNNDTWIVKLNTTGIADLIISSLNADWEEIQLDNIDTIDEMKFINISCSGVLLHGRLKIVDINNVTYDYINLTENDSIKPTKFLVQDYNCDGIGEFANLMNIAGYATLNFTFGGITEYAYDPNSNTATCSGDIQPSGKGEWNITQITQCENGTIIMDANLSIRDGGALTLRNVTLLFNSSLGHGAVLLKVAGNGNLTITDFDGALVERGATGNSNNKSNVSTFFPTNRTTLTAYPNSRVIIKNTIIENMGWATAPIEASGITLYSPALISNATFSTNSTSFSPTSSGFLNIAGNYTNLSSSFIVPSVYDIFAVTISRNFSNATTDRVYNTIIEYSNFTTIGNHRFFIINATLSRGLKLMHNNFLSATTNDNCCTFLRISGGSELSYIYNNSFISRGESPVRAILEFDGDSSFVNNPNITFTDNKLSVSRLLHKAVIFHTDANYTINFINNTFNFSRVNFENIIAGGLIVQWYADINLTYANGSVAPDVNVTLYNATGNFFHSFLSEPDGITRINVTERFINGNNYSSLYNNYTITANVSQRNFNNFSGQLNLTKINPESADTPLLMYNISLKTAQNLPMATCSGNSLPPINGYGEWNITDITQCENGTIIMNSNMTIRSGGHLILRNVTLLFNNSLGNGNALLKIAGNGNLTVVDLDNSATTSNDASNISTLHPNTNKTSIIAYPNSKVIIKNSFISGLGWGSTPTYARGMELFSPALLSNLTFTHTDKFATDYGYLVINPEANHTVITSSYFVYSVEDMFAINFVTNASNGGVTRRIANVTIEYTNFTNPSTTGIVHFINASFSTELKLRHNKFLIVGQLTSCCTALRVSRYSENVYVYNNSFISKADSSTRSIIEIDGFNDGVPFAANPNHTYVDNIFNTTRDQNIIRFHKDANFTVTFINNSFNYSKVNFALLTSGGLIVQWYADMNTTYANGSVASDVNVTLYNSTGNFFHSFLSEPDGITRINVAERFINGLNYGSLYNNYTITANISWGSFINFTGQLNLTKRNPESADTPMLMYNITLLSISQGLQTAACSGNSLPPIDGDGEWNITDITQCENGTIIMNSNMTIRSGGHLILRNVTLLLNNTLSNIHSNIKVSGEGNLTITDLDNNPATTNDASNISVTHLKGIVNNRSNIFIYPNARFTIKNSLLSGFGVGNLVEGIKLFAPSEILNSEIKLSSQISIYPSANNTNISGNHIIDDLAGTTYVIVFAVNGTINGIIKDVTISNNNFTIKSGTALDLSRNSNDRTKIINNKFLSTTIIISNILINNNAANIYFGNNSFILKGGTDTSLANIFVGNLISSAPKDPNWTFADNIFNTTTVLQNIRIGINNNFTIKWINNTFNYSKVKFDAKISGGLEVQWYATINVTYGNGSIAPNVNVTLRNVTNDFFASSLTDVNGLLKLNITEQVIRGDNTASIYNNYTITANVSQGNFNNFSGQLNLTKINPESADTPMLMYNISLKTAQNLQTATCSGNSLPPINGYGEWNITDITQCENGTITMNSNMTIRSGGHLILKNVTLSFNNALANLIHGIKVANNGNLTITDLDGTSTTINDASNITVIFPSSTSNRTFIDVYPGAKFIIKNSFWSGVGSTFTGSSNDGLKLYAPSIITNITYLLSNAFTIYPSASFTNITSNFFDTAPTIIFTTNTSYGTDIINNVTIAYNNFTGSNVFIFLPNGVNYGTKIMHNKFLSSSGNNDQIRLNNGSYNLLVYNNSFINIGSNNKAVGLINFRGSSNILRVIPNQTFVDNTFNTTGDMNIVRFLLTGEVTALWINNSFNYSKVTFEGEVNGGLIVQWYADINTTYINSSVASNVNVTLYNATGNFFHSFLSEADGITRINVTERFINGMNYSSLYNNYTITANTSDANFKNFIGKLNLTKLNPESADTPLLMYNISLGPASIQSLLINFTNPTPVNNTQTLNNFININLSVTSNSPIEKVLVRFNNTNYTLPDLLSCNYEGTYLCDSNINSTFYGNVFFVGGKFGEGVFVNSGGNLSYAINPNTQQGTFMFWIQPAEDWSTIASARDIFDNEAYQLIGGVLVRKLGFEINSLIRTSTGGSEMNINSSLLGGSAWHHLALTYGGSNFNIYVDGNYINSTTYTGSMSRFNETTMLGNRKFGPIGTLSAFDEFKVYSSRLTPEEIKNIYNYESGTYYINITNLLPQNYTYYGWANNSLGIWNITETRTFTVLPVIAPNITKVEITDDGILRDCNSSGGCFINPVIHYNATNLNVRVSSIDPDGGCNTATHKGFIYFCLNKFIGSQECNSTVSNFTFELDNVIVNSTLPGMQECNFTFSSLKGPQGTMPFFIEPGDYKFDIELIERNVSLASDPERTGKWSYTSLIGVGYTDSTNNLVDTVKLGGNNPGLNQWNSGTDQYNMSNWGNVVLNINWNATNPTNIINPLEFWNLALYSNRFQVDDDADSGFIDNSLRPLNLTYGLNQFVYNSGLLRCNSYDCSNSNATLPTYFHINPPSIAAGTYNTIITYAISKFEQVNIKNNIFVYGGVARDASLAILDDNSGLFVLAWCDSIKNNTYFSVQYTNGTSYLGPTVINETVGKYCRVSVTALNDTSFIINYIVNIAGSSDWRAVGKTISNQTIVNDFMLLQDVEDVSDVTACTLNSTSYILGIADDVFGQNNAKYSMYHLSTAIINQTVLGIANPDTDETGKLLECDAVSNDNWIYAYYDGSIFDIDFNISNGDGTVLNSVTVDTSAGDSGDVVASALSNGKYVVGYCDGSDQDITFNTYTTGGVNVSGVIDVNLTVGNCADENSTKLSVDALNDSTGQFVMAYSSNIHNITLISVYNSSGFAVLNSTFIEFSPRFKMVEVKGFDPIYNKSLCKHQTQPVFLIAYNNLTDALWKTYYSNGSIWDGMC